MYNLTLRRAREQLCPQKTVSTASCVFVSFAIQHAKCGESGSTICPQSYKRHDFREKVMCFDFLNKVWLKYFSF